MAEPRTTSFTPPHARGEDVVEERFGARIADPYRWLEDGTAEEVQAFVATQNDLTRRLLDAVPARGPLAARLAELLAIGHVGRPAVHRRPDGSYRYFSTRRDPGDDQAKLVVRDTYAGADRVLVDPNTLDPEGTTALDWYYPAPDGSLVAYGLSERGTEQSTLRVIDVATGAQIGAPISRTRSCSLAWYPDASGFYFTRYPTPGSVPPGEEAYHRKVWSLRLGEDPDAAPEVFRSVSVTGFPTCALSPTGHWLVVSVAHGWSRTDLFMAEVHEGRRGLFRRLSPEGEAVYHAVVTDTRVYVVTNEGATRYRAFAFDPEDPERSAWREVIPEHASDVLEDLAVVGGELFVTWQRDGQSRLERFDAQGTSLGPIALPAPGRCSGFTGHVAGREAFYDFESFAHAPRVERYSLDTGTSETWQEVTCGLDPSAYTVDTHEARSPDGTLVPFVVVRHRATVPGEAPTLLYGYGGFNHSLYYAFSRVNLAFLERGGIYVQANLRGGGERGESWHRAGMGPHKQNTFDDFIAVAETLVARGIAHPDRLAIHGRSNGGLLVAAAITQRPELFRAAVCGVPLTDMLRYPRFLVARLWIPEYGDPEDPEQFRWLAAYSPYHHVRPSTAYPATLVTTAAGDSRVDPLHARKLVASLQAASTSGAPILLRTEAEAGHGAGKPVSKLVEEYADVFAFLTWQLAGDPDGPEPAG